MPNEPAKRILLIRPGKPKRKFILTEPPYPEVGDVVNLDGEEYRVWGIEDTTIVLRVPGGAIIPKRSSDANSN